MAPVALAVVGGGAAGYFGAIRAAELLGGRGRVVVLEATRNPLKKVLLSGGGRCNVTHECFAVPARLTRFHTWDRDTHPPV